MVLESFLPKRRRKNVVTGVRLAASSRSNTGQNDIKNNANFSHSTVLLVKTSELTNINNTTLEYGTYF